MLVEDYDNLRGLMKIIIHHLGYEVIEAENGSDAVEKCSNCHPDLILMDLSMPIMDGIAATQKIRQIKEFCDVPIIALTGFENTDFDKARKLGFDNVIIKPFRNESLETLVNSYLS